MIRVADLRCEHLRDPLGIEAGRPRLSFTLRSARAGARASGYEVRVRSGDDLLWESGPVEGPPPTSLRYGGDPIPPRTRCAWTARAWDEDDEVGPWAPEAVFETGIGDGWTASWIAAPEEPSERDDHRPSPYLRRAFELRDGIVSARAYVTGLGLYELWLNGGRVSDDRLRPGSTDYTQRVPYQTYDVTGHLAVGANAVGVVLADGWYRGYRGVDLRRGTWGVRRMAIVQLEVSYADGSGDTVVSDASWRCGTGEVLDADLYMGELRDARLEPSGWTEAGFDDASWGRAEAVDPPAGRLVARRTPPVRVQGVLPVDVTVPMQGIHVADLGRNIAGVMRLRVRGEAEVRVRHGEALTPDGLVYRGNLRRARQEDRHVGEGTFEPRFTVHGFRYAEIEGLPARLPEEVLRTEALLRRGDIEGVVLHSDLEPIGAFRCSDDRVNAVHDAAAASLRANLVDVLTDCPQRDERMGWTGDVRVSAPSLLRLYDARAFLEEWLEDVLLARDADGIYPDVAPNIGPIGGGAPAWADAGVHVPWALYEETGDPWILERHLDAMRTYVLAVADANPDGIWRERTGANWGDWLSWPDDPDVGRSPLLPSVHSTTPREVIATAMLHRSAVLAARAAEVMGEDPSELRSIASRTREAFGGLGGDTQTAHALASRWGLDGSAGARLAELVAERGHLTTGMIGTEHVLHALFDAGRDDLAWRVLLHEDVPGWLHMVASGATTLWERWDGWTPANGYADARMNSLAHHVFSSVVDVLHSRVAGLAPASPGWERIEVDPRPGGGVTWAQASHRTPRGWASVAWRLDADRLHLEVTVPPGATADVRGTELGSGTHFIEVDA